VREITSYLHNQGGDDAPKSLFFNTSHSHHGSYIYGAGFTFDDNDQNATPLRVAADLVQLQPITSKRILPYLGGHDILNDVKHRASRMVINLNDLSEKEARDEWPPLLSIVEEKVRPERMRLKDNVDGKRYKINWWRWARHSTNLELAKKDLQRVLVHPFTSSHLAFVFVPTDVVVGSPHNVFSLEKFAHFAALQSRVHETWVRFFSSTLETRLRYVRSDSFDTFAFPFDGFADDKLEMIGQELYEFRASIMVSRNEGLTKIYNRLHNPNEKSADIVRLRALHDEVDRAVLTAYGWTDLAERIASDPEAMPRHLTEDTEDDHKYQGRYFWPAPIRDEVLARLLALNAERAEAERLAGLTPVSSEDDGEGTDEDDESDDGAA
jgi:hypothetical protein